VLIAVSSRLWRSKKPAGAQRERSVEGITGMPWIEIDFAADVERATSEILISLSSTIGRH
jgi:choline kinase